MSELIPTIEFLGFDGKLNPTPAREQRAVSLMGPLTACSKQLAELHQATEINPDHTLERIGNFLAVTVGHVLPELQKLSLELEEPLLSKFMRDVFLCRHFEVETNV